MYKIIKNIEKKYWYDAVSLTFEFTSTIDAVSIATSVPDPIDMPKSA